jgi:uncharacterized membrane protein YidH (DUF202 family)
MVRSMLVRGLLAGLVGGVLAAAFALVVGEPQVGRAISIEDQQARAAGEAVMPALVSRPIQGSVGLLVGAVVYGLSLGGLFSLVFAAVYGRVVRASPARTAIGLAAAGFVVVFLVPFLKYPATPPAVGRPETIGLRTELYLLMLVSSLLAAAVSVRLGRWLAGRLEGWAASVGVGAYLAMVLVAGLALPSVDEVPAAFPAVTLWNFRVASLGTQVVMWAAIGLIFAVTAGPLMTRARPE